MYCLPYWLLVSAITGIIRPKRKQENKIIKWNKELKCVPFRELETEKRKSYVQLSIEVKTGITKRTCLNVAHILNVFFKYTLHITLHRLSKFKHIILYLNEILTSIQNFLFTCCLKYLLFPKYLKLDLLNFWHITLYITMMVCTSCDVERRVLELICVDLSFARCTDSILKNCEPRRVAILIKHR